MQGKQQGKGRPAGGHRRGDGPLPSRVKIGALEEPEPNNARLCPPPPLRLRVFMLLLPHFPRRSLGDPALSAEHLRTPDGRAC